MISYEKVLPIGTVVTLDDSDARLMIMGYQRYDAGNAKIYDYCACTYPEGYISDDNTLLFDHEQIHRVIYVGLQNAEQSAFSDKLRGIIEERKSTVAE